MSSDKEERDLRLELLRLDRKLKLLDLARLNQQLVYGPIRRLLLVGIISTVFAVLVCWVARN